MYEFLKLNWFLRLTAEILLHIEYLKHFCLERQYLHKSAYREVQPSSCLTLPVLSSLGSISLTLTDEC